MDSETDIALPSGLTARLQEVITDVPGQGLTYRFRFVVAGLDRARIDAEAERVLADMDFLCTEYAAARVATTGPQPNQIIISLADRETVFAEPMPEAVQVFEAYSLEDGLCLWEEF